jgi:hypothetical protein
MPAKGGKFLCLSIHTHQTPVRRHPLYWRDCKPGVLQVPTIPAAIPLPADVGLSLARSTLRWYDVESPRSHTSAQLRCHHGEKTEYAMHIATSVSPGESL